MNNELKPFEQKEDWYTIEDLASLSGISIETLKGGHSPLSCENFGVDIKTESKIMNIGGHRNVKVYSENVLKALKEYQFKNSVPNAVVKKSDYIESHSEWYTLEEISQLSGLRKDRLNQLLPKLCNQLQNSNDTRLGGYHNTKKFYSENVLKALKEYQIRNSVPNALKSKKTTIEGNISVIQNQTVKQTINNLLDNPETLNMLLQESLTRNKALGIENKQLKDVIETQKPMVEGYTRIANSSGLKTIKEVANILGYGEKTYFALLRDKKILFKDNGVNLPMREYIESGYFEVKEEPFKRDGQTYLYSRVFVTAKGLLWLEKKTPKEA